MEVFKVLEINKIKTQVATVMHELIDAHPQKRGSVFVVGCSSSEVVGGTIGKNSSEEVGQAVFETARQICDENGLFLACQCCEHLNRALVVDEQCADKHGLEPVSVVPWAHGGGSLATAAYRGFEHPIVVEHIKASAGIDIGSTLIGMHLKDVAVPVHPAQRFVGEAYVTAAFSRPKLIGGERARYTI